MQVPHIRKWLPDTPTWNSTIRTLREAGRSLVDLVYPPHCVICGISLADDHDLYICSPCREELPYVGDTRCPKCGHELPENAPVETRCPNCTGKSLFFISATAPFKYENAMQELIVKMKLAHQGYLSVPLSALLIAHLQNWGRMSEIDVVVPVPLHWRRRLKRSYNQSELVARRVADSFGVSMDAKHLRRKKPTRTQTSYTLSKRWQNPQGAFHMRRRGSLAGKTVLLIDDVLTTGATCAECSRILRHEGEARAVYVATLARTMQQL